MKTNKNANNYPDPDQIDTTNVVSSSEFTGMIAAAPESAEQVASYKEIYSVPNQGKMK